MEPVLKGPESVTWEAWQKAGGRAGEPRAAGALTGEEEGWLRTAGSGSGTGSFLTRQCSLEMVCLAERVRS